MFFKKAKRFWAGVCVVSMLFTSINQNTLTVMATEDVAVETVAVAEEPEVLVEETSENEPAADDVVEVELPYVEEEEEFVVKASELEDGGTSDGDDICYVVSGTGANQILYGTFNRTKGILTFREGIIGIGEDSFVYNPNVDTWYDEIKVIDFEEGSQLKYVGSSAFLGLPNLQKVDFTNCQMLTVIYEKAFSGCVSMSEVILSNNLQEIDKDVFKNCQGITTITLTPNLIAVGNNAFSGCKKLATVIIQSSNMSCGTSIFAGCTIDNIQFSGNNTVLPGNLFNGATFKETAQINIPYYVQEIGDGAFKSSTNLTSVTFEDTEANPSALASIGKSAFYDCAVLQSVTFPNSVKVIEESAYQGCASLTTLVIPNTVTKLGASAFKGCTGIKNLTLSNAISSLGASVFEKCFALKSVVIPSGLTLVSDSMFKECIALSSVTIPTTVKSIGKSAFEKCASLPTIVLPDTVETVGSSAFKECKALDNPTMPKELAAYPDSLFQDCLSLGTISTSDQPGRDGELVIPGAVKSIGSYAFEDCDQIYNLTISQNVEVIKGGAFQNDSGINTVLFETLDMTCGTKIFCGCLLVNVVFPQNITAIPDNLFSSGGFNTNVTVTIPATVTTIGKNAFGGDTSNVTSVTNINFETGSQLTTIGEKAFAYCTAITKFDMPLTVTSIGKEAFKGSKNLQAITIPENVTSIGAAAFQDCEFLTTVRYDAVNSTAGTSTVSSKKVGPFVDCNIHTILLGEKVENLPAYLFCGAKFSVDSNRPEMVLITLNIPASVGEIGEYAFSNITNLSKVNFAENSQLRLVGNYAFNECGALTECKLPDTVTTIGNSAFRGCTKLAEMKIPTSLINLGSYAFYQCTLIKEYKIPAEVTSIEESAFYSNTALETITFEGYNITAIGASAYEDCTSLKAITIPSGTTSIGAYAFKNDVALEEVVIPASVTEIGTDAFKGCTNAKFLVIPGSYAETWLKANGFENQIDTTGVYVITYELDGGENNIRNIGGYKEGDVFTFFEATKPGYSFDGWYLDAAFTNRIYDLTGRTGNFTLYAKWVEGNYTITYELNGGENHPDNPTSYTFYDAFKFQNPTREGYDFKGWYLDKEWKTGIKEIKEGSWGDKTLYARWEPKTYTVKFDGMNKNAVLSAKSIKVKFDQVYGDLPTATREGYMFDGWYTEDNVLITKDTVVSIAANHTLYAKWVLDIRVENPTSNIQTGKTLEKGTGVILSTATPGAYIYYTLTTFAPEEPEEEGTVDGDDATTDGNDGATDGDDKNNDTTDGSDGTSDGGDKTTVAYAGRVLSTTSENVGGTNILYSDPIVITENTIIRAFAVKEGYKNSEVVEFVYYVEDEKNNWGDLIAEDRALFKDGSEVPEGIWVAGVKDTEYTGKAIKFNVRVYDHKTMLTEKKDYTIKYSNNKKVASATDRKAPTVTINGKGNYKGKQLVKFNILRRDISGDEFEADDMWAAITGKVQKPVPVITWGKTKLKNKKDFTVDSTSAMGYSAGGTYKVTVTGIGNYCGTRTLEYTLTDKPLMAKAKVVGVNAAIYTGKAITQPISVTHSGITLVQGTDYEVEYRNNVEVGTATVVITGKGNYAGIKKINFKINPTATVNKVKFTFSPVSYTGKAITVDSKENPLKISANYKGIPLTEGVDYVVDSYSNNVAAGKGTVVIRGINSYSGTVKKTFKIDAANVAGLKLKFIDEKGEIITGTPTFGYCKGGAKPSVYLEYEGKALKAGTDYTLSYKKNKALGVATITVKGKKNFKGTLSGSFTITQQDIGKLRIDLPDVPYQNAANIYATKPVIYDLDGRKLAANKDYSSKVVYTYAVDCYVMQGKNEVFREGGTPVNAKDILPVGTMIKATVSGSGNYVGQIEGVYRIVKGTIAKAKVTVIPQEYTGKAVQPGKSQLTVVVGNTTLAPTDYEIVGYSKNVSAGTATITLRGAGDYGGTVTAKFKIYQQNFIISKIMSLFGF